MKFYKSMALGLFILTFSISIKAAPNYSSRSLAHNLEEEVKAILKNNETKLDEDQIFQHNEFTNIAINLQSIKNYEIYSQLKVDIKQILDNFGHQTALEYLQTLSTDDLEHKFYKALLKDDYDLIELFVETGIDVNKEIDGRCPLATAIKKNKPNACRALLNANADYNITIGCAKSSPVYYAYDRNFEQVAAYLIKKGVPCHGNQEGVFKIAFSKKQIKLIEALLETDYDLNKVHKDYIKQAVRHPEILKVFLDYGLNPNFTFQDEREENSLLFKAIGANQVDSIKLLLANRANINIRNAHGKSPLDYAISLKKEQIIKLLKEHLEAKSNI